MDKMSKPVPEEFLRGDTESVKFPEQNVYRNPGPTERLRDFNANTNVDKGVPFSYEGAHTIDYNHSPASEPFRTWGGEE